MKVENKKLRVEIIGEDEQLQKLAYFLRLVEYLGNVGSTRTLKLWVDGDGAARLHVNFPDIKDKIEVNENVLNNDSLLRIDID